MCVCVGKDFRSSSHSGSKDCIFNGESWKLMRKYRQYLEVVILIYSCNIQLQNQDRKEEKHRHWKIIVLYCFQTRFGEQLCIVYLYKNEIQQCKITSEYNLKHFVREWSQLDVYTDKLKIQKLAQLQSMMEIHVSHFHFSFKICNFVCLQCFDMYCWLCSKTIWKLRSGRWLKMFLTKQILYC